MGGHPMEGCNLWKIKCARNPKQEYQWLQKWLCTGPRNGTATVGSRHTADIGSLAFLPDDLIKDYKNICTFTFNQLFYSGMLQQAGRQVAGRVQKIGIQSQKIGKNRNFAQKIGEK